MRILIVPIVVTLLGAGPRALAGDMSYSYLQLNLMGGDLRGGYGTLGGAGWGGHASAELAPHTYVFGGYSNTRYVGNGLKVRFIPAHAGVGGYFVLSPEIDLFGGVAAERLEIRRGTVGFPVGDSTVDKFTGWSIMLGGRGWLGENFQWTFDVKRRDLKNLEKINSVSLGGRYYIRRAWAIGMEYTYQKYDNSLLFGRDSLGSLNIRYTFAGY